MPRVLSYEQETEQGIEVEEFPIVVVASGELVEQVRQSAIQRAINAWALY